MRQAQHIQRKRTLLSLAGILTAVMMWASPSNAQYFQSSHAEKQTLKASGFDSVILERVTPFELPRVSDSIEFTYHEPMPDSIMPRSAVVIGKITLQAETSEDLVEMLEKYARKSGADWIVSFSEPRASLNKDKMRVYRSSATLLRVLDPNFIQQSDIAYNYYEKNQLQNFAAVQAWFDTYGRHLVKSDQTDLPATQDDQPDMYK